MRKIFDRYKPLFIGFISGGIAFIIEVLVFKFFPASHEIHEILIGILIFLIFFITSIIFQYSYNNSKKKIENKERGKEEAQNKLRESEEKYRMLFDNSPFAVGLVDMTGKIIDVNRVHEIRAGYSKEDLIGKPFTELSVIPEKYIPIIAKEFKNLIKSGNSEPQEIQVYSKDGSLMWIYLYASLVKLGNKVVIQVISQNITTRKEVEQELIKLNKIKSEFLRRASHELKTPLISIKGFSNLILSLHGNHLDPEIISYLNEIDHGCERLQLIINDLLKTSQLESFELIHDLQEEDLAFLIKFCVNELNDHAIRRKHSIELNIHNKLSINIEKEEIHEVLSNLLSNAIKYIPPNGKIKVETKLTKGFVIISVRDNGIGFTDSQKQNLFQQFGKIERYGKGLDLGIDGTGLGLYISKRIVELHGGKIWMESEGKNKGSTFYFTPPFIPQ